MMDDENHEEWPVGSPAWQAHQREEIALIPDIFSEEEEDPALPGTSFKANTYKAGDSHIWQKGDSLFDLAQDMHVTRERLMEYNEIEAQQELEPGIPIYYPVAGRDTSKREVVVEVLPEALPMHVQTPGGAKKWTFGNMKKWADAKGSGFFPQNTNLTIVATVKIPILDENDEEIEAGYYLDSLALGDYSTTGRIKWMVGYIWSDLAEGHIDPVPKRKPAPLAEQKLKEQKAKVIAKKVAEKAAATPAYLDGFDQAFIEKRLAEIIRDGKDYFKLSRQILEYPIPCTAEILEGREDGMDKRGRYVVIHDIDTRRPDRRLYHNQEVTIAQTFEYDGILMGRPLKACETGNWFGVDMALLQADKDLYNDKSDATTRKAEGRSLTWSERFIWVPLAKRSATHKIKTNNNKG
jgi:hypothetical protein